MICLDRKGNAVEEDRAQGKILRFLYRTAPGRLLVRPLTKPFVSKAAKRLLSGRLSARFVKGFARRNGIEMSEYTGAPYGSFNAFFTRSIKPQLRRFDEDRKAFCAPCDSRLSVYPIDREARFMIKGIPYTMEQLTRSRDLAAHYEGGTLLLFRLTVRDYHHYACVDDGRLGKSRYLPGILHTVNPIAVESGPVYRENARCRTLQKTENFGTLLYVEVGAMMVGEIVNIREDTTVKRGDEKGYFSFGGSTVIICAEKGRVVIDRDIMDNSLKGIETQVHMGERIGSAGEK